MVEDGVGGKNMYESVFVTGCVYLGLALGDMGVWHDHFVFVTLTFYDLCTDAKCIPTARGFGKKIRLL